MGNAASDEAVEKAISAGSLTDSRQSRDRQQHHESKPDERDVEREDHQAETLQQLEGSFRAALFHDRLAHRERQCGRDAQRGELHDDAGEFEHHLRHGLTESEHRLLRAAPHLRQPDREEHRPEDDLQHLVVCGRIEKTLRHDVLEHTRERDLPCRRDRTGGLWRYQRHADTGLQDVDGEQADEERECRDDFEIDDGLQGEPADALHVVAVSRDADDQRAEDERHDDRFDHPEKYRGDRAKGDREPGEKDSDQHADHHGRDDPLREGTATEEGPHGAA